MDKYEFNIKVEQIKKLVNKGDYETAMKIADTIDWRRVRSANLLALVAEIYENNEEYQEAKEVLLLAFERAPIGKRLLYKLADLALKENNLREAEDYYREFCDLAPEDPRQHLLRYQILKVKKAPDEQLIHSLERYTNTELDEKWLYELAELYCRAGKEEECIQTCDKIMLMFGLGKYVDKAMQLKVQYAPLSSYQMDLIENRDKYEEKLRAVEQGFQDEPRAAETDEYDNENERQSEPLMESRPQPRRQPELEEEADEMYSEQETPVRRYAKPIPVPVFDMEPEPRPLREEPPARTNPPIPDIEIAMSGSSNPYQTEEEEMEARIRQAEAEARLAREMSKISIDEYNKPDSPIGQTKVIGSIREILSAYSSPGTPGSGGIDADRASADTVQRRTRFDAPEAGPIRREEVMRRAAEVNYLMIETRIAENGLELAVEVLKRLHKEKGCKNPVVKISGSKLSRKGVMESAEKLAGKDLIIEEAGDLTVVALIELQDMIETSEEDVRVIMIDSPRQIESLYRVNPSLAALFTVMTINDNMELEIRRPELLEKKEEATVQVVDEPLERKSPEQPDTSVKEAVEEPAPEVSVMEEEEVQPVVAEAPEVEAAGEALEEAETEIPQEAAVIVEEEPPVVEEDPTAAMAEFMKMMETVIEEEPVAIKPEPEPVPSDNTAAVMAEFMRLMESVIEEPAAAMEKPAAEAEIPYTAPEIPYTAPEIPYTAPEIPYTASEPPYTASEIPYTASEPPYTASEIPYTAAMPAGMETPVTPVSPIMPTMQADRLAATSSMTSGIPVPPMTGTVMPPVMNPEIPTPAASVPVPPVQPIPQPVHDVASMGANEEMELHEFVEYTCKYASDIDCSITGKSMLALYERIEVMEENGVPLTKINAENLIEEAADKAEKFSFKKLFTGLFHPRYDKEGLLILREEHFMN